MPMPIHAYRYFELDDASLDEIGNVAQFDSFTFLCGQCLAAELLRHSPGFYLPIRLLASRFLVDFDTLTTFLIYTRISPLLASRECLHNLLPLFSLYIDMPRISIAYYDIATPREESTFN